jgi:hypothetical protein
VRHRLQVIKPREQFGWPSVAPLAEFVEMPLLVERHQHIQE